MVYTNLNRIQFGNGDVSVMVSMAGTRKEPQAMLVFQNREPTKIIAMLFSKPESIDCVISALLAVKKVTFGKNNLAHIYLDEKPAID